MQKKAGLSSMMAVALLTVGIAHPAVASEEGNIAQNGIVSTLTTSQYDDMKHDVELLFTRYVIIQDEIFTVNSSAITQDGFVDKIQHFQDLADVLNIVATHSDDEARTLMESRDAWNFTKCVLGNAVGVGIGTSPNLIRAVINAVKAWNWGLTVKTISRILGSTALKGLGGPWGLAASLGVAAWSCRGQW